MSMIARWHEFWHVVGSTAYGLAMPRGSIETLRTGFRARVYAGKDPITGKQTYLCGETRRHRRDAEADAERLVAAVEAERAPRAAQTVRERRSSCTRPSTDMCRTCVSRCG